MLANWSLIKASPEQSHRLKRILGEGYSLDLSTRILSQLDWITKNGNWRVQWVLLSQTFTRVAKLMRDRGSGRRRSTDLDSSNWRDETSISEKLNQDRFEFGNSKRRDVREPTQHTPHRRWVRNGVRSLRVVNTFVKNFTSIELDFEIPSWQASLTCCSLEDKVRPNQWVQANICVGKEWSCSLFPLGNNASSPLTTIIERRSLSILLIAIEYCSLMDYFWRAVRLNFSSCRMRRESSLFL